jgi:hypothetical protein
VQHGATSEKFGVVGRIFQQYHRVRLSDSVKEPPTYEVTMKFHYSCDGQSFGELDVDAVLQRIWANPNANHLVWREGFAQWTAPSAVPEIMDAWRAAQQAAEQAAAQQAAAQQAAAQQAAAQQAAAQQAAAQQAAAQQAAAQQAAAQQAAAQQAAAPAVSAAQPAQYAAAPVAKKSNLPIIIGSAVGGVIVFIVLILLLTGGDDTKSETTAQETSSTTTTQTETASRAITESEVRTFFDRWLAAWNNIDAPTYSACYSRDFYGIKRMKSGTTKTYDFQGWIDDRITMARKATGLLIQAEDLNVSIDDASNATVRFTQFYYSQKYSDQGPKVLKIRSENGTLKIVYEELEYSTEIDYVGADGAPDDWQ